MSDATEARKVYLPDSGTNAAPARIAVIFGHLGKLSLNALRYLIVHLNTLQSYLEFELLEMDDTDDLLMLLREGAYINREECQRLLPAFHDRVLETVTASQENFELADRLVPQGIVLITLARFSDGHYGARSESVRVQALGNWERYMAPPSLLEFSIVLLLRQSVSFVAPTMSRSAHLGTKGCLFDFTPFLSHARYRALQGFVCSSCRDQLKADGAERIADEMVRILSMEWLGSVDQPRSPAGIVAKLGHNLFLTQGLQPTLWESIRNSLRDEATKEVVKIVGGIILAALLLWLGLKN